MDSSNEENKDVATPESNEPASVPAENAGADTGADTANDPAPTPESGVANDADAPQGDQQPTLDGSEPADVSGEVPADVQYAKYRIVGEMPFTDASGTPQMYVKGTIQELPTFVGDVAVEQGIAEKVEE